MPLTTNGSLEMLKAYLNEGNTPMTTANTTIGVGNGTTSFSVSDTALAGASQEFNAIDSGFPQRSGAAVTFQATFSPSEALFDWREYGIKVGSTLISRKVENLGNKGLVSQTWIFVITATQAA